MAFCGFINLLKPPGMTSHDVVQVVRRMLNMRAIGHTGTLDPAAAGVLVLAVGPATRLAQFVETADKAYRAEITCGVTTDTLDAEGVVTSRTPAAHLTEEDLRPILSGLVGPLQMRPPAHSAVSVGGQRLYDLARKGVQVEAPLRDVFIHELRLLEFRPGDTATALLDVVCSKGTYIRTLAEMIGAQAGCGAHLSMLLRTRVGAHRISSAVTFEELAADPAAHLLPLTAALPDLPQIRVDENAAAALRHGQGVPSPAPAPPGPVLVVDESGEVVCLGEAAGQRELVVLPRKVFPRSAGPDARP